MKKSTTKRTPKKNSQPHRYFLMPTTADEHYRTLSRIVIFPHGKEKGSSYFSDTIGDAWWTLAEMATLGCVEVPAALIKRIAKV